MTQRKDVAANIEQAAQDIMVYLLTFRGEEERKTLQANINHIFESAKKIYSGEDLNYFWQFCVIPFSRSRGSDLDSAVAALAEFKNRPEEIFGRFTILVGLLTSGACKSTSLNTYILDRLIEATDKYYPINEDEAELQKSEKDNETTRVRLRRIFLEKARIAIKQKEEEQRKDELTKKQQTAQKENVEPGRIDAKMKLEFISTMNDFLKGKIKKIDGKIKPEVQKFAAKDLADKHAVLLKVFGMSGQKAVKIPPVNDVLTSSPASIEAPVNTVLTFQEKKPSMIMDKQELLAALRARVNVAPEISPLLPTSYEETVVQLNPAQDSSMQVEVKSGPGRLSQNKSFSASFNAMNNFFAKKVEAKAVGEFAENTMSSLDNRK